MAGISSKAAGALINKKKYNGIEFDNDLDIDTYEAELRNLDPQTGRWWQVDPKTDEMYMWSTYASNFDNPIRYEDQLGDEPDGCCKGLWDAIVETGDQVMASASGLLWGSLNTATGGLVPTDPFNIRPALSPLTQQVFDKSVALSPIILLLSPGSKTSPKGGVVEIVPVGGKSNLKVVAPTAPIPTLVPPASPKQSTTTPSNTQQMKGERNRAGSASGTDNPFKKLKPDTNKSGNVIVKDANGKTVSKKAPEGFQEYWNKKHK